MTLRFSNTNYIINIYVSFFFRIATLRHSESSSDEENQAFFVGGGERSGQQVLGPPRKDKKKPGEIVQDLFKSAKE